METVVLFTVTFICAMFLMYNHITIGYKGSLGVANEKEKYKDIVVISFLVLIGLFTRIGFAVMRDAKATDIGNFQWLGSTIMMSGVDSIYQSGVESNFPPVVLYIYRLISDICKTMGKTSLTDSEVLLMKLPGIICDMAIASVIYKFAKKRINQKGAFLCGLMFILCPPLIMDSAVWGQLDSIFALCAVLMCIYLYEDKIEKAFIAFAVGVLSSPLMLMFSVVILVGLVDALFFEEKDSKRKLKIFGYFVGSVAGTFLAMLPLGIKNVFNLMKCAINSLPYVSINGYNFWAMIGINWQAEEATKCLGMSSRVFGFLITLLFIGGYLIIHYKNRKNRVSYIYLAIVSSFASFMFVTRMHERYLVATSVICLLAIVVEPMVHNVIIAMAVSVCSVINMGFVMYVYDPNAFNPKETTGCLVGSVLFICFLVFIGIRTYFSTAKGKLFVEDRMKQIEEKDVNENELKEKSVFRMQITEKATKWTKYDFIALFIIMAVYSAFALRDIGNRYAPSTFWECNSDQNNQILVDMGQEVDIDTINYYLGYYDNRKFNVEYAVDEQGPWTSMPELTMVSVFCWGDNKNSGVSQPIHARYVRLTNTDNSATVMELVFKDAEGNILTPVNTSDYPELFDEQEMCPKRSTFRDSTYFDEIYHARTAYEFLHDLNTYEWTHPPLGKIFISIGVYLFGMNPFGWRIIGILFGIFMLPVLYAFALRFFKKTSFACITTILFAFDFMHFAQTRIATIDTYVTFFVICMYYYMYKYYKMSFYDTELKKTFIPLGLCGITMGLGMASKWTGIYAGGGLAVIFFITIYRRTTEYVYAKKEPTGTTDGISHKSIIEKFPKNTIRTLLFCVVFFVIIPATIYALSYIPVKYFRNGFLDECIRQQKMILDYHNGVSDPHPFASKWWQWPIIYRPIWYYSGTISDTVKEGISSFGNPAVWWAGIPAFFFLVYRTVQKKDKKAMFLVIGYLSQYLPWVLVGRTVFIYHYFTSVPFVVMMVAYSLYVLVKEYKLKMPVVFAYVTLAVVLFVMFYPVLSGQPVNTSYVDHFLRWFDSWVLV